MNELSVSNGDLTDKMFHFTCFNVEDPDDHAVGLVNGEVTIPGNLLRREVFDPVVNQVCLADPFTAGCTRWRSPPLLLLLSVPRIRDLRHGVASPPGRFWSSSKLRRRRLINASTLSFSWEVSQVANISSAGSGYVSLFA